MDLVLVTGVGSPGCVTVGTGSESGGALKDRGLGNVGPEVREGSESERG
jgi:hypothetical protein